MTSTAVFLDVLFYLWCNVLLTSAEETSTTAPNTEISPPCQSYTNLIDVYQPHLSHNYVICKNATLTPGRQLPIDGSSENLKYILFQNSTLKVIPPGVFNGFVELSQLYLNQSGVKTILPGVFNGLTKLEELYLQDNKITEISRGTLNFLPKLTMLDFSKNLINRIEVNSLSGLLNLKVLNLGHNKLKFLDGNFLVSVNTLETLDVSHNYISKIDDTELLNSEMKYLKKLLINNNAFKTLPVVLLGNSTRLELLDASFNYLTQIDFDLISSPNSANYSNNDIISVKGWPNLNQTEILDLRKNKIENINYTDGDVQHLQLGWNKLKDLGPFMFENSEDLVELDLSYNLITTIHVNSFHELAQLMQLNLNNNKIRYLPIGCFISLSSLKTLSLAHNSLTNINYGVLGGLSNLTTLHLDYNKLTVIHEKAFHVLDNLQKLYLNHNMLTTISASILLTHLPNLKLIDLNDNKWDCGHLLNAMGEFKNKSVDIFVGNTRQSANILGVSCTNFGFYPVDLETQHEVYNNYENFLIVIIFMLALVVIVVAIGTFGLFRFWMKVPNSKPAPEEEKLKIVKAVEGKCEKSEIGSLENVYCNLD